MSEISEIKMDEATKAIISEKEARNDALASEIKAFKAQIELKANDISNLQKKLDAKTVSEAEKSKELKELKAVNTKDAINAKTEERLDVFLRAGKLLGDDTISLLHHSNREIMEAAINSTRADAFDFNGKTDEYVGGVFDNLTGSLDYKNPIEVQNAFNTVSIKCDESNVNKGT